ncbi:bacteriocin immunity protein, partial [Streptomyces sp. NPDC059994]|uniref:bacteriocin immunity protein n=1 Tax=Streptomyces sp. NPDC059994 TaxID=3347029 RepID=UPI00367B8263
MDLVQRIMDGEGTEEEHSALVETLERNVLHPRVCDLIYYPENEGYDRELTTDQVIEPPSHTGRSHSDRTGHPHPVAGYRNPRSGFRQAESLRDSRRSQRSWLHPVAEPPASRA